MTAIAIIILIVVTVIAVSIILNQKIKKQPIRDFKKGVAFLHEAVDHIDPRQQNEVVRVFLKEKYGKHLRAFPKQKEKVAACQL